MLRVLDIALIFSVYMVDLQQSIACGLFSSLLTIMAKRAGAETVA